jgi:hypothetical protein
MAQQNDNELPVDELRNRFVTVANELESIDHIFVKTLNAATEALTAFGDQLKGYGVMLRVEGPGELPDRVEVARKIFTTLRDLITNSLAELKDGVGSLTDFVTVTEDGPVMVIEEPLRQAALALADHSAPPMKHSLDELVLSYKQFASLYVLLVFTLRIKPEHRPLADKLADLINIMVVMTFDSSIRLTTDSSPEAANVVLQLTKLVRAVKELVDTKHIGYTEALEQVIADNESGLDESVIKGARKAIAMLSQKAQQFQEAQAQDADDDVKSALAGSKDAPITLRSGFMPLLPALTDNDAQVLDAAFGQPELNIIGDGSPTEPAKYEAMITNKAFGNYAPSKESLLRTAKLVAEMARKRTLAQGEHPPTVFMRVKKDPEGSDVEGVVALDVTPVMTDRRSGDLPKLIKHMVQKHEADVVLFVTEAWMHVIEKDGRDAELTDGDVAAARADTARRREALVVSAMDKSGAKLVLTMVITRAEDKSISAIETPDEVTPMLDTPDSHLLGRMTESPWK